MCRIRTEVGIEIDPRREGGDGEQCRAAQERDGADGSHGADLAQFARAARSVEREVLEQPVESAAVEHEAERGEQRDGAEEHVLGDRDGAVVLREAEEQDPEQQLQQVDGHVDGEEDGPQSLRDGLALVPHLVDDQRPEQDQQRVGRKVDDPRQIVEQRLRPVSAA